MCSQHISFEYIYFNINFKTQNLICLGSPTQHCPRAQNLLLNCGAMHFYNSRMVALPPLTSASTTEFMVTANCWKNRHRGPRWASGIYGNTECTCISHSRWRSPRALSVVESTVFFFFYTIIVINVCYLYTFILCCLLRQLAPFREPVFLVGSVCLLSGPNCLDVRRPTGSGAQRRRVLSPRSVRERASENSRRFCCFVVCEISCFGSFVSAFRSIPDTGRTHSHGRQTDGANRGSVLSVQN